MVGRHEEAVNKEIEKKLQNYGIKYMGYIFMYATIMAFLVILIIWKFKISFVPTLSNQLTALINGAIIFFSIVIIRKEMDEALEWVYSSLYGLFAIAIASFFIGISMMFDKLFFYFALSYIITAPLCFILVLFSIIIRATILENNKTKEGFMEDNKRNYKFPFVYKRY